jgi:RNA polymerase sigma-70 factor (ECF subfamily)
VGHQIEFEPVTTSDPAADDALVRAARRGERAAFEELVRRTGRLVYARIYLDTCDPHHSEDLVQETYLIAWKRLGELSDPRAFRSWLLRIAQGVTIDAARRAARKKRAGASAMPQAGSIELVSDTSPSPVESAAIEEERRKVLSALRELPEEYRLPLMLRYLSGADYDTIGKQLALTNGSLRGLLARGLKLLRERLGET